MSTDDSVRVEQAALETEREPNPVLAVLRTSIGRNAGLVLALLLICVGRRDHGRRPVHVDRQRPRRSFDWPPSSASSASA